MGCPNDWYEHWQLLGSHRLGDDLEVTSPTATVILFWPWSTDDAAIATRRSLHESAPPEVQVISLDPSLGLARALNEAERANRGADLAIIADACELPEGWLERMRGAACADDTLAAATALPASKPLFAGFDGDPVLGAARANSTGAAPPQPVHARIFRLWPYCTYIRRSALELLGPFDETLDHPAAVLAEFAARALVRGLSCSLADDVVVRPLEGGLPPCPETEMAKVSVLHPWIEAVRVEEDALELGPLRRSLVAARVAGRQLSVTIDARALGPTPAGTQAYVSGLVLALARSERVAVRAVLRDDVPRPVIEEFERAGVELVMEMQGADGLARTDIAHRPQQAFVPEDLSLLRRLGERVVITHLDLIAYRNPTYHDSRDEWRRYRRLTRVALAAADRVVFLSEHARRDAVAEDLIEPVWTAVVGVGIEQEGPSKPARKPDAVPDGRELLVMIGADYMHKNRLFALELVDELRRRHDWNGLLVLAGAHVAHGGSAEEEAALVRSRPALASHVHDLGPVEESEKQWLLDNGHALLCPSTYEGFGLTPLEAAAASIPCLYAATTALCEVVGADAATIVPWDAAASADRVSPLLQAGEPRERHLASLRHALRRHDWESVVDRLCEVYQDAIHSPYRSSVPRAWEELLVREQLIVDLDRTSQDLRERVAYGLALIDRDGLLTREQQRGLMRLASRRWLRAPLLGPIGLLGGIGSDDSAASSR
jgi:glycosyltransferase involved in cell wall biosynthesis